MSFEKIYIYIWKGEIICFQDGADNSDISNCTWWHYDYKYWTILNFEAIIEINSFSRQHSMAQIGGGNPPLKSMLFWFYILHSLWASSTGLTAVSKFKPVEFKIVCTEKQLRTKLPSRTCQMPWLLIAYWCKRPGGSTSTTTVLV